jgi:transposase InsO family protein
MCTVVDVSPAGYHAWRKRTTPSQRALADERLMARIRVSFARSKETYGAPRVHADLKAEGIQVGRKHIARLMHDGQLRARRPRRWTRTTDSTHALPIAPNVLAQQFAIEMGDDAQGGRAAPERNRLWVGDITYLPTDEGFLYLSAILDLSSRRCIGWAMRATLEAELATSALRMAIAQRRPPAGVLFHSDRGVQYASEAFRRVLAAHGMQASMSRKGNCWDNAVAESFFATLEVELVARTRWRTRAEARRDVFAFIETWYNRKRRHSTLGYRSPATYEHEVLHGAA